MLRPVPTRLDALRFGADPVEPKPGFYADTGGYAWKLDADRTLSTVASPGKALRFTPADPRYAAILAKITADYTDANGLHHRVPLTYEQVVNHAKASMPQPSPQPTLPQAPAPSTLDVDAPSADNGGTDARALPRWVLPAAAVVGATGLALVLFPNLLPQAPAPPLARRGY
jgi:hypothetical protein